MYRRSRKTFDSEQPRVRIDQINSDKKLVYVPKPDKQEFVGYLKAILFPATMFVFSVFVVDMFASLGRNIIAPLTGIMWIWGVICAFLQSKERMLILTETHVTLAGYLGSMAVIRFIISLFSGVSAESLMASFDQVIPITSGNNIPYFLQTILMCTMFLVPVGFIGAQGKRLYGSKKDGNARKVFQRYRGYIPDDKK